MYQSICRFLREHNFFSYLRSAGLYFLASLIPMFLTLLINPAIAQNMSPNDYAITGYYASFSGLLSPFIVFYMLHYYNRRYFTLNETERIHLKTTIFKSLVSFSFFVTVIGYIGVLLYTYLFNRASEVPIHPYAALSIFALPLTGIYVLRQNDLRMTRRSKEFFMLTVSNGVLLALANLLFVVVLKKGALGKLTAQFLSQAIVFGYCLWAYRELFSHPFDRNQFKDVIKFCLPLTIAAALGYFTTGFDKMLLERSGNLTEMGYYVVGAQMAGYILVFQSAIGSTFQPDLFGAIAKRDRRKTAIVSLGLVGSVSVIALLFALFSPIIVRILTAGRYMHSVVYMRILSISVVTSTIYGLVNDVIIALGYSRIILWGKIVNTIFCIGIYTILISLFGCLGAAWGNVLVFVMATFVNISVLFFTRSYHESSNT